MPQPSRTTIPESHVRSDAKISRLAEAWSNNGPILPRHTPTERPLKTSLQLAKRGITVKGLLLIDAPNPEHHVPLSTALISAAASLGKHDNSEIGRLVQKQFAMNSAMLKDYPYIWTDK